MSDELVARIFIFWWGLWIGFLAGAAKVLWSWCKTHKQIFGTWPFDFMNRAERRDGDA